VFIINNDQNITFLGHTGPLIIFWALMPLGIVTIHYFKWGFETWGVTPRVKKTKLEGRETCKSLKVHLEKEKGLFESYPSIMSHLIEETIRETGMARCHNRRLPVYLKE
jgi:hypothetical protein